MSIKISMANGYIVGATDEISRSPHTSGIPLDSHIPDVMTSKMVDGAWRTDRLFYAGRRSDGYDFYGYVHENGLVIVMAGCRSFAVSNAKEHWDRPRIYTEHEQSQGFIGLIEAWADETFTSNGSVKLKVASPDAVTDAPPPPRARTPARIDLASVYQFLGPQLSEMFFNWQRHVKGVAMPHPGEVK